MKDFFLRRSPLAAGAWLLAVACSGPSATNFFDSPAAGTSSVAGADNDAGGRAASDSAGASLVDEAGSRAISGSSGIAGKPGKNGGAGGESGKPMQGGSGGSSGSVAVAGSAGISGDSTSSSGTSGDGAGASAGSAGGAGLSSSGGSGGNAGTPGNAGSTGEAGGSGDPVVELDGEASASSWENDFGPGGGVHPPRYANDGDLTTRWCAAAKTLPQWWQVDLGASHALSRVEIVWEYPGQASGSTYGYKISVSDDATLFPNPPAIDNSSNQSTTKKQIASFAPEVAGRYVRITVTSLPPDTHDLPPLETWASINKVRVFGHE